MLIPSCPKETKSLQYITLRLNKYLDQHPEFSYKQVLDSTNFHVFKYSQEISDQIVEDYDFEFIYPEIIIQYLLYNSNLFFQAWLYNISMKLFN